MPENEIDVFQKCVRRISLVIVCVRVPLSPHPEIHVAVLDLLLMYIILCVHSLDDR